MRLTTKEISLILELLREKYGFGYSKDPVVGPLQAKLSMMGQVASERETK